MKRNAIRLISGILLAALLGLLAIQWHWVQNAVALREGQFRQKVYAAMGQVSERLQEQEIFLAFKIEANLDTFQQVVVHEEKTKVVAIDGHTRHTHKIRLKEEGVVQLEDTSAVMMVVQQDCVGPLPLPGGLHTDAYAVNIVRRMLRAPLPLKDRIQREHVDSLLRIALAGRGISDAFSFTLEEFGPEAHPIQAPQADDFRVQLFPHDLPPSNAFLKVDFPDRANATMQAMGLLLPTSGVLVLVVVGCFAVTLVILRRQKRLSEMKTDFINNMTHELKTPISTISLAVQALEDPDMQAAGKIGQYAGIIREENERLRGHVERVLQAAAGGRGELRPVRVEMDLVPVLRAEVERMAFLVASREGRIELSIAVEAAPIKGDPVHVAGILHNLIDNANKYSPDRPEITVTLHLEGGKAVVSVTDKGIGMGREARRRIFEQFYRVPTGNLHDAKGFGLGLSYVQSMVHAHGGSIDVRSEPGKGSTFRVSFPLVETSHP